MKAVLVVVLLFLPLISFAQYPGSANPAPVDAVPQQIDPSSLNVLIQQAQNVQACMAKIDQAEMERVRAAATAKAEEVQAMCASGERAGAQSEAVAFGKQLVEEPVLLEMKACLGIAGLEIPQMTWAELENSETTQTHVCDM